MFQKYALKVINENLKDDEKIIRIIRSHLLKYFFSAIAVILLLLLPTFFFLPLVRFGIFGKLLIFFSYFAAVLFFFRQMFLWRLHCFVVTDKRVMMVGQTGLLKRTVSECIFDNMQGVRYNTEGLLKTLFHLGDVRIMTFSGEGSDLLLDYVHQPEQVQKLIKGQAGTDLY